MAQYERNWATHDIIKQYLQGRAGHACRKAKVQASVASDADSSSEADPEDPDLKFDPSAALQAMENDEQQEQCNFNTMDEVGDVDTAGNLTTKETLLDTGKKGRTAMSKPNKEVKKQVHIKKQWETKNPTNIIYEDDSPSSVFVDEDGFFLDHKGDVIEAKYNATDDTYVLADGSALLFDAWPTSLENYATCFGDGVSRPQNTSGHWRVGCRAPNNIHDASTTSHTKDDSEAWSLYHTSTTSVSLPLKETPAAPSTPVKSAARVSHVTILVPDSPLSILSDKEVPTCTQAKATKSLKRKHNEDVGTDHSQISKPSPKPSTLKRLTHSKGKDCSVCTIQNFWILNSINF